MKKGFPSLLFQSVARVVMDLPFATVQNARRMVEKTRRKEESDRPFLVINLLRERWLFFSFSITSIWRAQVKGLFFLGYEPAFRAETPQVEIPKFVNTLKYVNTLKVAVLGPRGKPPFLPSRNCTRVGNTTGGNTTGGTNQDNLNSSAGSFGTRPRVETPKLVNTPKECLHKA